MQQLGQCAEALTCNVRVGSGFMRGLLGAALLVLFALLGAPRMATASDPQEVVRQASEQVLAELAREGATLSADPQRLYALVDAVLLEHMDFARMARWVLGKHWKAATPEQQARFVAEFRRLLVRTYATALAGYRGQRVEFLPRRDSVKADEAIVRAEILQPGGPAIPVQFNLHRSGAVWKAYDVSIDGISLVANYRASFGAEVRRGGLEGLINALAARNQQAFNSP